jgi:hypothetical protein
MDNRIITVIPVFPVIYQHLKHASCKAFVIGNEKLTMVWNTGRPLLQDIRGITCLCNPSLAADDFPSVCRYWLYI